MGFADRCGSLLSCHVTLKTQVGGSSLIGHLVGAVINFTGKAVVGTVIVWGGGEGRGGGRRGGRGEGRDRFEHNT